MTMKRACVLAILAAAVLAARPVAAADQIIFLVRHAERAAPATGPWRPYTCSGAARSTSSSAGACGTPNARRRRRLPRRSPPRRRSVARRATE